MFFVRKVFFSFPAIYLLCRLTTLMYPTSLWKGANVLRENIYTPWQRKEQGCGYIKEEKVSTLFFLFLDSSCYYRRTRKKNRTPSYYYSSTNVYTIAFVNTYIGVISEEQNKSASYPGEKKEDILEIMDTYNHDDMHHQYGKNGNYNHLSMIVNCGPKKVKKKTSEKFIYILNQGEVHWMTYIDISECGLINWNFFSFY